MGIYPGKIDAPTDFKTWIYNTRRNGGRWPVDQPLFQNGL